MINLERKKALNDHLMLFFTGIQRFASEVSESQIANMGNCFSQMQELYEMAEEGSSILTRPNIPLEDFGKLLDRAWHNKKTLSNMITNTQIDDLYKAAINAGAIGGKILGAGAGGFVLFFVKPQDQKKVKDTLKKLTHVPFNFENTGSKIVVYQPNGF